MYRAIVVIRQRRRNGIGTHAGSRGACFPPTLSSRTYLPIPPGPDWSPPRSSHGKRSWSLLLELDDSFDLHGDVHRQGVGSDGGTRVDTPLPEHLTNQEPHLSVSNRACRSQGASVSRRPTRHAPQCAGPWIGSSESRELGESQTHSGCSFRLSSQAHLSEEVAGSVDDFRLPSEAVNAIHEPHQLHDSLHAVQVSQILCKGIKGHVPEERTVHMTATASTRGTTITCRECVRAP